MRVIRSSGQNVSPSDDGRLFDQAFENGLFEATSITSLGGNLVSIGAMYGIMCGRDFTTEAQNINVLLPSGNTATGYIYVKFDTSTAAVITIESALAPFTPQYDDINTSGTVCEMVLATYEASSVAVTSLTPVFKIASTKPNDSLIGSMAQVETSPAISSHAVGSYILWNYQLYEVTSAISAGETLVVGSNISATSIGDEISDVKSDINGVCHIEQFVLLGGATFHFTDVSAGDMFIFTRNGSGIAIVADNGGIYQPVALSGISNISYSNGTLTFTRNSQYSGGVVVYSAKKVNYYI